MTLRRIILAIESRLLRDMLRRALENVHGVRIVGEYTDRATLLAAVAQSKAQWVIVSLAENGDMPAVADFLRTAKPRLNILAVALDGSRTRMRVQDTRDEDLNGMSLDELIEVLQGRHSAGGQRKPVNTTEG